MLGKKKIKVATKAQLDAAVSVMQKQLEEDYNDHVAAYEKLKADMDNKITQTAAAPNGELESIKLRLMKLEGALAVQSIDYSKELDKRFDAHASEHEKLESKIAAFEKQNRAALDKQDDDIVAINDQLLSITKQMESNHAEVFNKIEEKINFGQNHFTRDVQAALKTFQEKGQELTRLFQKKTKSLDTMFGEESERLVILFHEFKQQEEEREGKFRQAFINVLKELRREMKKLNARMDDIQINIPEEPEDRLEVEEEAPPEPSPEKEVEQFTSSIPQLDIEFTPRQKQVFDLDKAGYSGKAIAKELGIDESAVTKHKKKILVKLKGREVNSGGKLG
jgi:ATP/maltotriose-dependent transcriptional regulator MalT